MMERLKPAVRYDWTGGAGRKYIFLLPPAAAASGGGGGAGIC